MKYFISLLLAALTLSAQAHADTAKSLSLNEAITLAVRTNPNVQSSQLSVALQKFNEQVQAWAFQPHYAFQTTVNQSRSVSNGGPFVIANGWNASPSVSLLTPIGTQMTLTANSNYNPTLSLQIMQPLMRGFGKAVVEAALNDAKDESVISRLSLEGVVKSTITSVIDGYLDVVAAEKNVKIDQDALKRATLAVTQTRLFIKAGHKAGNEIVTVQANAATAASVLENDTNALLQAKYNLLQAIGLDPNANLNFTTLDLDALIKQYQNISLEETKKQVLANDIQYQIDSITLNGPSSRSVLVAEDNSRWQLNVTADATLGGGENTSLDNAFNAQNQTQSIGITLTVPIQDQYNEQAVMSAKISLQQAKLALLQEKWAKETSAITAWNSVQSAARALVFAKNAEAFQVKTYQVSYQKYIYGLIDSLELQSAQNELISAQQSYLSAEINYIKSLVDLDMLIGHTLATWKVTVRLS